MTITKLVTVLLAQVGFEPTFFELLCVSFVVAPSGLEPEFLP